MTGYELNDKGVVYLIEAIGVLAISDYKYVRKLMSRKGWEKRTQLSPGSRNYELNTAPVKTLVEIEDFFHGGWFEMLSGIDGDRVLDRIERECDEAVRKNGEAEETRIKGRGRKHKAHAPGSGRKPSTTWEQLRPVDPELAGLLESQQITRATLAAEMGVMHKTLCVALARDISPRMIGRIKEAAASIISKRTR